MRGTKSRSAASLTWCTVRLSGIDTGVDSGAELRLGVGSGAGSEVGSGVGGVRFGMEMGSSGAIGSGAGVTISTFGSGKGPTGSPSSPVSPSGTEDGAATGSEKTGSTLVVLVMSSIAFCKSLSTD